MCADIYRTMDKQKKKKSLVYSNKSSLQHALKSPDKKKEGVAAEVAP